MRPTGVVLGNDPPAASARHRGKTFLLPARAGSAAALVVHLLLPIHSHPNFISHPLFALLEKIAEDSDPIAPTTAAALCRTPKTTTVTVVPRTNRGNYVQNGSLKRGGSRPKYWRFISLRCSVCASEAVMVPSATL